MSESETKYTTLNKFELKANTGLPQQVVPISPQNDQPLPPIIEAVRAAVRAESAAIVAYLLAQSVQVEGNTQRLLLKKVATDVAANNHHRAALSNPYMGGP